MKENSMERRVRVFINQLLPDIVGEPQTKPGIEFAYDEVVRLGFKFVQRLQRENMFDEIVEVQTALHKAVGELSSKYRRLIEREHTTETFRLSC